MKKLNLLFLLLALASPGLLQASDCYECGNEPLYECAWDVQVQGGVDPIVWRQRDNFSFVNCLDFPTSPVVTLFEIPKFHTFFKTPWIIGGQIGYAWACDTRVYVEFNYSQAKAKCDRVISNINFNNATYKLFDAYVGLRYYWGRWCDHVAFFLGGKIGLTHHKSSDFAANLILPLVILTPDETPLFKSNTVFSGGANAGFDICFWENWSFVVTGEVVASCGPRSNRNVVIPFNASTNATNLLIGDIGTELRFPVTAGLRYSF